MWCNVPLIRVRDEFGIWALNGDIGTWGSIRYSGCDTLLPNFELSNIDSPKEQVLKASSQTLERPLRPVGKNGNSAHGCTLPLPEYIKKPPLDNADGLTICRENSKIIVSPRSNTLQPGNGLPVFGDQTLW